jgi:hypothetical protein
MRFLLLALVAVVAGAQTISFAPQPFSRIPGLNEYRVYVAAPEGQPMQVQGMKVFIEGLHRNIRLYSYPVLAAYVANYNRRSWARYVGIGMEIAGWVGTSAAAGKVTFIKERWITAGMPLLSAALTLGRSYYDREYQPTTIPADLMQPLFAVPAGQAVDFAVWSAP